MPKTDLTAKRKKINFLKEALVKRRVSTTRQAKTLLKRRFGTAFRNSTIGKIVSRNQKAFTVVSISGNGESINSKYVVVTSNMVQQVNNKPEAIEVLKDLINVEGLNSESVSLYKKVSVNVDIKVKFKT